MIISDADKPKAFAALYNAAVRTGHGDDGHKDQEMIEEQAIGFLASSDTKQFDIFRGRAMKVDFSVSDVDLSAYDVENGPGVGEAAITAALNP